MVAGRVIASESIGENPGSGADEAIESGIVKEAPGLESSTAGIAMGLGVSGTIKERLRTEELTDYAKFLPE